MIDDDIFADEEEKPKIAKNYVKNADLYAELLKWRDTRVISEALGDMMLKIATRYMTHPNYVRYPDAVKEDIIGSSVFAMIDALNRDNYNFDYKNPFAYFTQICWSCAMDYLSHYYKDMNFRRELVKQNIIDTINEGINTQSSENYLKILNSFCFGNEGMEDENAEFLNSVTKIPDEKPDESE